MGYLEMLREILPKVFKEVEKDILNEKEIKVFIEDKGNKIIIKLENLNNII